MEKGELEFRPDWIDRNRLAVIEAACERWIWHQLERLRTLKDALPPEITYDEIRLVVARLRREAQHEEDVDSRVTLASELFSSEHSAALANVITPLAVWCTIRWVLNSLPIIT